MRNTGSEGILADVRSWTWLHWSGVLMSFGLAMVNLFVGYTTGESPFFVVGASFLFGVGLFFTRFWQPVLYLLGLLHIAILGILWLLSGMRFFEIGLVTGGLSLGVGAIALYLFFEEMTTTTDDTSD